MESIITFFADLGVDFPALTKAGVFVLLGALLLCAVLRFIYRKKTLLVQAVSSSIAIIFICVVSVLLLVISSSWSRFLAPLPLVSISNQTLTFFTFQNAGYSEIASQLLSMIILAFLVNLADNWLPKGKNIFKWFFWRCLTVLLGLLMHFAVSQLMMHFLPQGIILYAPAVLLGILIIMLLTGALKLLVGLFLTTVNPIIGALYTFFFANIVGKQITRAVMTTGILCGIIAFLGKMGIAGLSIAAGALIAYIPFLLILILVWYVVNRFL